MLEETIYFKKISPYIRLHSKYLEEAYPKWRWVICFSSTWSVDTERFKELKDSGADNETILREIKVSHPRQHITLGASKWFDYYTRDECYKAALIELQKRCSKSIELVVDRIEKGEHHERP